MKKLPSVSSLQAFEAAARLGSFTLAAEELNMAQSAISRQVRGLEDQLGARLFDLIRQRIILTGDGLMFLEEVRPILAKLEAASRRVSAHAVGIQPIEMATLPTFCSRWLIPRLPKFYEKNPRASLNFTSKFAAFSFDTQPFDLAIHFGKPDWPDTTMHHLFQEKMVAICSSEFLKKHNIRSDKDLAGVPLLHLTVRLGQWSNWFDQHSISIGNAYQGRRYDQFSMLTEAAAVGLGAALMPELFVEEELRTGKLVVASSSVIESPDSYYLAIPDNRPTAPAVSKFCEWLLSEVALSGGSEPATEAATRT